MAADDRVTKDLGENYSNKRKKIHYLFKHIDYSPFDSSYTP